MSSQPPSPFPPSGARRGDYDRPDYGQSDYGQSEYQPGGYQQPPPSGYQQPYGQDPYAQNSYGQDPYGQQPYRGGSQPRGREPLAIVALVLTFVFWPLAVIFAIVALIKIRGNGKKGKVMSIISLLLSAVFLASTIAVFALADSLVKDTTRDTSTSAPTGTADADTFLPSDIREGDCLNGVTGAGTVTSITAVGCTTPHESQAFAVFDLPAADVYPGDTEVDSQAESGCVDRVGDTIGAGLNDGSYTVIYLSPRSVQWAAGFHGVSCLVLNTDGSQLTAAIAN